MLKRKEFPRERTGIKRTIAEDTPGYQWYAHGLGSKLELQYITLNGQQVPVLARGKQDVIVMAVSLTEHPELRESLGLTAWEDENPNETYADTVLLQRDSGATMGWLLIMVPLLLEGLASLWEALRLVCETEKKVRRTLVSILLAVSFVLQVVCVALGFQLFGVLVLVDAVAALMMAVLFIRVLKTGERPKVLFFAVEFLALAAAVLWWVVARNIAGQVDSGGTALLAGLLMDRVLVPLNWLSMISWLLLLAGSSLSKEATA
jgi:hypothetical protein